MRVMLFTLQLLVAGASVANIFFFRVGNMFAPRISESEPVIQGAMVALMLLTAAMWFACWRGQWPPRRAKLMGLVSILALTVLAGFTPRLVAERREAVVAAERAEDNRRFEEDFAHELQRWAARVDALASGRQAFAGEEAWAFFKFVVNSDLSYRGLADHRAEAIALLQRALADKSLDPNVPVQGARRSDTTPRPLFLQFYAESIEPGRRVNAVRADDWQMMQVLAANGVDLARPDAAALVGDLAKTAVPGPGRFVTLR
jgi:hypothetical protein